jgi:hypothetical protein
LLGITPYYDKGGEHDWDSFIQFSEDEIPSKKPFTVYLKKWIQYEDSFMRYVNSGKIKFADMYTVRDSRLNFITNEAVKHGCLFAAYKWSGPDPRNTELATVLTQKVNENPENYIASFLLGLATNDISKIEKAANLEFSHACIHMAKHYFKNLSWIYDWKDMPADANAPMVVYYLSKACINDQQEGLCRGVKFLIQVLDQIKDENLLLEAIKQVDVRVTLPPNYNIMRRFIQ